MKENKIMTVAKETKEIIAIELLALKKKFIPKDFISYIYYRKDVFSELYNIVMKSRNREEFYHLLEDYFTLKNPNNKKDYVPRGLLLMKFLNSFPMDTSFVEKTVVGKIYKGNEYNIEEIKQLLELYSSSLVNYINKNNKVKHRINNVTPSANSVVTADYTKEFTLEEFQEICKLLGVDSKTYSKDNRSFAEQNKVSTNINVLTDIIAMMVLLYDKNTLLNNKEFVDFELNYGYTDKYYNMVQNGQEIPSLESRIQTFNKEKVISEREQYLLTQLDLLEERISTLTTPTKDLMLQKIALIRMETDITKKATLIIEVNDYYEREYRKQIVESLYSPTESHEVSDIDELGTLLLHVFIRDPYKLAEVEETKILEDVTKQRGVKVTKVEDLTPEEREEYNKRIKELHEVLLNPVVTNRSVQVPSFYSYRDGFRWYKSDTSNQISASIVSYEALMNLGDCIGVGFDSNSIDPRNIIISSNQYQTTNMGVSNLEINREDWFRETSAPLSELMNARLTEVVMYRSKDNIDTKAAYVFASISGTDSRKDEEIITKAREFAEKNHIKLIVFNRLKLKQSYEEKYGQNKKSM